jgi:hypothetical protein
MSCRLEQAPPILCWDLCQQGTVRDDGFEESGCSAEAFEKWVGCWHGEV